MNQQIRLFSLFFALTLILVACGGYGEQDNIVVTSNDHPLFDMLKRTPMRFADSELYYLDFRAVEDALPYVDRPQAGQIFYNDWTRYAQRWVGASSYIDIDEILRAEDTYMLLMGFELRDVNRIFSFGSQPDNATIWSGEFDEEAIRTAHTARGFSAITMNGAEAWCYSGDCSTGKEINQQDRVNGNLFDSRLGRKVPFLMLDDLLISTPSQTTLEESANIANSLYDNADIQALAQASTAPDGLLVNWIFIPAVHADRIDGVSAVLANLKSLIIPTYNPLPMYNAVAIADRQEGDKMVALVLTVYGDDATAQTAATELESRIATFNDYISRRDATAQPIWSTISGFSISHSVYKSDTGRYVAVIRMEYDTPTEEQAFVSIGSGNAVLPDAMVFQHIWWSFIRRGFYPLWTGQDE